MLVEDDTSALVEGAVDVVEAVGAASRMRSRKGVVTRSGRCVAHLGGTICARHPSRARRHERTVACGLR